MKRLLLILLLASCGCAKMTMSTACPAASIGVGFALAGSTVGNQAVAMLGAAVSAGKIAAMAKAGAGPTPVTTATMSYEYFPIFGADSGNLLCIQPQQQTIVVTSPPATVVQQ